MAVTGTMAMMEPTPVMPYADASATGRDSDHLRLLTIFHYIVGVLICLFASLFIFHVVMGIWMVQGGSPFFPAGAGTTSRTQFTAFSGATFSVTGPPSSFGSVPGPFQTNSVGPPTWFGYVFAVMGAIAVIVGWSLGICTILSGQFIARRKYRLFSLIIAGVLCAWFPFGTVLGVFTFVVLFRESVKATYGVAGSLVS